MSDLITVVSALPPSRVALWERHPDHPGGEVFISGEETFEVAETLRVEDALRSGRLVKTVAKQLELTDVKGVGPKRADSLVVAGINTVDELVNAPDDLEVEGLTEEKFVELKAEAAKVLGD